MTFSWNGVFHETFCVQVLAEHTSCMSYSNVWTRIWSIATFMHCDATADGHLSASMCYLRALTERDTADKTPYPFCNLVDGDPNRSMFVMLPLLGKCQCAVLEWNIVWQHQQTKQEHARPNTSKIFHGVTLWHAKHSGTSSECSICAWIKSSLLLCKHLVLTGPISTFFCSLFHIIEFVKETFILRSTVLTGTGNPWARCPLVSTDVRIVDHFSLFFAAV